MSDPDRRAFDDATRELKFTKDFYTSQEAIMHDPMETHGARFMAWLKRKAWGNYRLYAVRDDGQPATQADCERELEIKPSTISHAVAYYETRGYLRRVGKLLYPVIAPQLETSLKKVARSPNFLAFLETWKVARSSDFQELEVARSTVKRLRKVILSDYKKWLAPGTNPAPSLMRDRESLREEGESVGRSASPPSTDARERTEEPTDRPTDNPFKERIGDWLRATYTLSFPLEDPELDQIAATIHSDANFEQFQKAMGRLKRPLDSWRGAVKVALSCVPLQANYERTMAAGAGEDPLVKRLKEDAERRKQWDQLT